MIGEPESPGWKADSNELIRLNSEGEETVLDEEYLSCLSGRMREDHLFLAGNQSEDEYFESLSDIVAYKDQTCNFCKVETFNFQFKV